MAVAALAEAVALHVRQRNLLALEVDRPAFDGHALGHGIGPRVGLAGIADDVDRHALLVGRHEDVAHVAVGPQRLAGADRGDNLPRIGMHRPVRHVLVPGVVTREDLERGDNAVGLGRVEHDRLVDGGRGADASGMSMRERMVDMGCSEGQGPV